MAFWIAGGAARAFARGDATTAECGKTARRNARRRRRETPVRAGDETFVEWIDMRMIPPVGGLTAGQVRERIEAGKSATRRRGPARSTARIVLANLLTIFNLINLSVIAFLVVFYLKTGDGRLLLDSVGLIILTVANTVIAIVNETRAVKKLKDLERLKGHEVRVVRDGEVATIDREDLVADDVVALHTGDQVPIDGRVVMANHLEVDESPLTGDSEPVLKHVGDLLRAGSFCVYGGGYYEAVAEPAAEADGLAKVDEFRASPLLKEINLVFIVALVITVIISAAELLRDVEGGGLGVEGVRKISTMATTLIPEGLMFFATITFAVGIYRIARHGALVQRINALDSLPGLGAVCIDKTGTLTRNALHVAAVVPFAGEPDRARCQGLLGAFSELTSEPNATSRALECFTPSECCRLVDELPFRSELKMSAVRLVADDGDHVLLLGGYDVLLARLGPEDRARAEALFTEHHLPGYRTLLFVELEGMEGILAPESIDCCNARPLCIVAMTDEVRPEARAAIRMLEEQGVDVKILSGDSADAVAAAMRGVGRRTSSDRIVTGDQIEGLPPERLAELVGSTTAFARLTPEQKHEILRGLRLRGLRTGMIGDGVNDLPAMKEADVSIAMGAGSTVAREVASIVLLENSFGTIRETIDEGNRIINTVICVARLFLVKTVVVLVLSLLPWFTAMVYPLTPRRGALMSVLGVGLPSYLVATFNRNAAPVIGFRRQVFPFVAISSLVMILGTVAAGWCVERLGAGELEIGAAMMAALSLLAVANYLAALVFEDPEGRSRYLRFSAVLLVLYLPFILSAIDIGPFGWLRAFYEIDPVPYRLWSALAPEIVIAIGALFGLHAIRARRERGEAGRRAPLATGKLAGAVSAER